MRIFVANRPALQEILEVFQKGRKHIHKKSDLDKEWASGKEEMKVI